MPGKFSEKPPWKWSSHIYLSAKYPSSGANSRRATRNKWKIMPCEHTKKRWKYLKLSASPWHGSSCCILEREWIKGPCRTLGSHEVLNLQRYVMLPGKGSVSGWCYTSDSVGSSILPACTLLHMFFVYLVLVSLGPVVSQWSVALIFRSLKHLTVI